MTRHRSDGSARGITADHLEFRGMAALEVSSPAFADGTPIPGRHSDYGEGVSPALQWSEGPAGTASYVVLVEDPDAHGVHPWVHWVIYNLPADVVGLPERLSGDAVLAEPRGAMQGVGTGDIVGYFGPRPPVRDAAHRYCFEVFALDQHLPLPAGATHEDVRRAMRGHVIASGVLMGRYAARP